MLEHAWHSLLSGASACSPSSTEGSTGLLVGEWEEHVLALLPVGEGGRSRRRVEGGKDVKNMDSI